ncbi:MAG: polymer-forming cytoskeletal protein [Lachnospiraceae bacterium]|nr:polymer-forming cytoskeletal protein [Lachnospiraceae bacterium]
MGFFQDLKEDLSLAVSELAGEEKAVETKPLKEESELDVFAAAEESMGIEHAEEEAADEEVPQIEEALGSFLDQVAANAEESESRYEEAPTQRFSASEEMSFAAKAAMAKASAFEEEKEQPEEIRMPKIEEPVYEKPVYETKPSYEAETKDEYQATDELAVVTANMTINGDMLSSGSLDVMGCVNGNVKVYGELNITGQINGNAEASNIIAANCNVTGDLMSTGAIKIGSKAVVRGNIYATSAVVSGAIKGDIDVHGPVILDSTAIVMGNIKSKAVQINNGAAVEGMCSQCYADVSPSAFFRD